MKNNLEYYRHRVESHNHWKFKALRIQYKKTFGIDGWAGEGKFWALNNLIADSDHCELNVSDEIKKITIANELDFDLKDLEIFLIMLEKDCKLIEIKKGIVTTDYTQEVLAEVQDYRQAARERQHKRRENLNMSRVTGQKFAVTKESGKKEAKTNASPPLFKEENEVPAIPEKPEVPKSTLEKTDILRVNSEMSRVTNEVSYVTLPEIQCDEHTKYSTVQYSIDNTIVLSVENEIDNLSNGFEPDIIPEQEKEKKTSAPKKKKLNPDTTPFWNEHKNVYKSFFLEKKEGIEPGWPDKELKALKSLLKLIKKDCQKEWDEPTAKSEFRRFLGEAWLFDTFTQKRFSLALISSNYSNIKANSKNLLNGTTTNYNGTSRQVGYDSRPVIDTTATSSGKL